MNKIVTGGVVLAMIGCKNSEGMKKWRAGGRRFRRWSLRA